MRPGICFCMILIITPGMALSQARTQEECFCLENARHFYFLYNCKSGEAVESGTAQCLDVMSDKDPWITVPLTDDWVKVHDGVDACTPCQPAGVFGDLPETPREITFGTGPDEVDELLKDKE